ncbi:MAG: type II RES/Xre toxin-antitoxin system antitoxin [Bacteroidota bacterium]
MNTFEESLNQINEAAAIYVAQVPANLRQGSLDKNFSFADFLNNKLLVIHSIRSGITFSLFSEITKITPFSDEDWAEILNISSKSLQRYRAEKNFRFKPIHSEKIIEIAEVALLGNTVFDTSSKFYMWLSTPLFALGSMKPIELLKDSYGKEMVLNELHRIDQGIFV